jgi:hypothetical protein
MAIETFDAGSAPYVSLTECAGTLTIDVGEAGRFEVESTEPTHAALQEDGRLRLEGFQGGLQLRVPAETEVTIQGHHGDLTVRGIRALQVDRADGTVRIEHVAGALRLRDLNGDLIVDGASSLVLEDEPQHGARRDRRRGVKRVDIRNVAGVELENVGYDLTVADAQSVAVANVGGKCTVRNARESFHYGQIGHDLVVEGQGSTVLVGHNIGGELRCSACRSVEVDNVGGGARIRGITGDTRVGAIGGNCLAEDIAGSLTLGPVGGDARLRGNGTLARIGPIGGNLAFEGVTFQVGDGVGTQGGLTAGGNARIELPGTPNLTVRVTAGGSVRADGTSSTGGGMVTLVYGDGASQLNVTAGGNVKLHGGGTPRVVSSGWGDWSNRHKDWQAFGVDFGRQMQDFAEQVGSAFAGFGEQLAGSIFASTPHRPESSAPQTAHATESTPGGVATAEEGSAERLAVLRMIAEGRITPDEGARLLDALR